MDEKAFLAVVAVIQALGVIWLAFAYRSLRRKLREEQHTVSELSAEIIKKRRYERMTGVTIRGPYDMVTVDGGLSWWDMKPEAADEKRGLPWYRLVGPVDPESITYIRRWNEFVERGKKGFDLKYEGDRSLLADVGVPLTD